MNRRLNNLLPARGGEVWGPAGAAADGDRSEITDGGTGGRAEGGHAGDGARRRRAGGGEVADEDNARCSQRSVVGLAPGGTRQGASHVTTTPKASSKSSRNNHLKGMPKIVHNHPSFPEKSIIIYEWRFLTLTASSSSSAPSVFFLN